MKLWRSSNPPADGTVVVGLYPAPPGSLELFVEEEVRMDFLTNTWTDSTWVTVGKPIVWRDR